MLAISINEPELLSIELIRLALSETTGELREKAILNAKHEVVAFRLQAITDKLGVGWMSEPQNAKFVQWIAQSSGERHEASYEFSQTYRSYEAHNERKLNVAEHIGKLIWSSIQDGRFAGLHTRDGILQQVRSKALELKIDGARDKDTLRTIWMTYRGVVHLGMAMDYCEENPNQGEHVLFLAENYRRGLSHFCPKGTKVPYVSSTEQTKFVYKSDIWGPRFGDRGLPFGIC